MKMCITVYDMNSDMAVIAINGGYLEKGIFWCSDTDHYFSIGKDDGTGSELGHMSLTTVDMANLLFGENTVENRKKVFQIKKALENRRDSFIKSFPKGFVGFGRAEELKFEQWRKENSPVVML